MAGPPAAWLGPSLKRFLENIPPYLDSTTYSNRRSRSPEYRSRSRNQRSRSPEYASETEKTVAPKLASAIEAGVTADLSFADMASHPVSVWVELTLGLTYESNKPRRAKPKTLKDAAVLLAAASGLQEQLCVAAEYLLTQAADFDCPRAK